jgi:L-asparaginase II
VELPEYAPLVAVRRGELVESVHRGRVVSCDCRGGEVSSHGNPAGYASLRSAAKPFQALLLISTGTAESFGLTDEELAVSCGSHSGEEPHLEAVISILKKAGLGEEHLQNGAHPPLHGPSARRLAENGEKPRAVHGNCSGKHAGMLAVCVHMGWDVNGYMDHDHPLQRLILGTVAGVCGTKPEEIPVATDGCGVPAFALSLKGLATGFACLASGEGLREELSEAAGKVCHSMRTHPYMVGGTGRFDTELMGGSDLIAKSGAEGVFACGSPEGWGVALDVSDGARRAVAPTALMTLTRLGLDVGLEKEKYFRVTNLRGEEVGDVVSFI